MKLEANQQLTPLTGHKKIQNTKTKCGLVVYKNRDFWFMKGGV